MDKEYNTIPRTVEEVASIVESHQKWLAGEAGGLRGMMKVTSLHLT